MSHQIFVLSTHYEGMPLALVEGMAAGCACVASDVVGVRGVMQPGKTGLLVPEGDAPGLGASAGGLLADPARAASLGQAARAQAVQGAAWPGCTPATSNCWSACMRTALPETGF